MASFDTSREDPYGIVTWMKTQMSRPLRVIEEHAEEIGQVGVDAVRARIEEMGRISPAHNAAKDGPESMEEGIKAVVTGSVREGMVNVKVGWDLTQYRHGYPQLQDNGFQEVVGMEALSLATTEMQAYIQRLLAD